MNSVAAPRLRNYRDGLPKARGLALGLTITAAPQLIARLTQVTSKMRSINQYLMYKHVKPSPSGRGLGEGLATDETNVTNRARDGFALRIHLSQNWFKSNHPR
jgi:hypothetical protein